MLEQRTTRRLQASWIVRLFVGFALLDAGSSSLYAAITDTGIHPPPTTGPYGFNSFTPDSAGFPAVGNTFVDPVFGSTIRRLTNDGNVPADDDIYAHHWCNANGTMCFNTQGGNLRIFNSTTGAILYSAQPTGSVRYEIAWDSIDPDKYYYYSGASLIRRSLTSQTNTTVKTFPATIQANGGSLNTQTRDGRYFTVRYGETNKVWDSQTDTIYSGSVTPLSGGGWVSISPDGNYMVTAAGGRAAPNTEHYSYPINHSTRSIGSTPTQFWGLCGDHGVLVSASNGRTYFVTFDCNNNPGLYAADVSVDQTGKTAAQQQTGSNRILISTTWFKANDGHLSACSKGANQNWAFADMETFSNDAFNSTPTGWVAYQQEILAMNVLTGEVRRLAQHRSRGLQNSGNGYWAEPKVSTSWDCSQVIWKSNFNASNRVTGYADTYGISNPLGASGGGDTTPPAAPVNLHIE